MSRRIEQWIESLGNRDEAHPRAMPNIVRERAQTWVAALEQRVREIEPAMQEAEARHAQANAVFDCAAVRLRTARSGTIVDCKRPVGIHSDRSDQADRGLRRRWEGGQTRRGRPVARQQRSEIVAIAHAGEQREDVAQVGERVFAAALTRHDDRIEDGGALSGVGMADE